jgi:probable F420-dependent oxidoreductase
VELGFSNTGITPEALPGLARESERVGYGALWMSETAHDPFVGLAAASQATERVTLRTGIAIAFARNPMSTAMLAGDMQRLSKGRFALGIGSQLKSHILRRFSMPWSHPAARMREYVLAVRAIWESFDTGSKLRFRGEFYRHTLLSPFFDPGQNPYGNPPILVAALGELMSEAAGEVGDGVLPHTVVTRNYLKQVTLPAAHRGRLKAGKGMDGFQVHLAPLVATGQDEATLRAETARVRQQLAFYIATPSYETLLELHGHGGLRDTLHGLLAQGRMKDMAAAIDDETLHAFAIVGEPKDAAAQLNERFGDIAHSLSPQSPDVRDPAHWLPVYDELMRLRQGTTGQEGPVPAGTVPAPAGQAR